MKTIVRPIGRYLVLILPTLLAVSCGNESVETANVASKMGQTETFKNDVMPKASIDLNIKTEAMPEEKAPEPEIATKAEAAPAAPTSGIDVPSLAPELGIDDVSQGFHAGLPYYCTPGAYPAHIINAIAACRPLLNQLYGTSWGYYPRLFDRIGYRIKHHVGRVSYDNDDDDGNDRRGRRGHRGSRP